MKQTGNDGCDNMEISYFIECYDDGKRSTTESVSKKCEKVAKDDDPTVLTTEKATTTSSTVFQTTTTDLTSTAASSTIR